MSKFDGILSVKSDAKNMPKTAKASVYQTNREALKRVGKRSNPDYTQITAYIRKNTHEEVMRKIYKQQEFSELLEELLTDWLKNSK
ncbi:MAG: hypothetical protein M3367_12445 [Acidobacteriota bacterium]|nr:hypothetical protein [Acidobacteriota bacterium]